MDARTFLKQKKKQIIILFTLITVIIALIIYYHPIHVEFSVLLYEEEIITMEDGCMTSSDTVIRRDIPGHFMLSVQRRLFTEDRLSGNVTIDGETYTCSQFYDISFRDIKNLIDLLEIDELHNIECNFNIQNNKNMCKVQFFLREKMDAIAIYKSHLNPPMGLLACYRAYLTDISPSK